MPSIESKQAIQQKFRPRAVLKALTVQAANAVPTGMVVADMVAILRYPFRVGRESRVQVVQGQIQRIERAHFRIEEDVREHLIVDRGSACGTGVGATRVGGNDLGGSAPLRDGDTISVGEGPTPYRYQFIVLDD